MTLRSLGILEEDRISGQSRWFRTSGCFTHFLRLTSSFTKRRWPTLPLVISHLLSILQTHSQLGKEYTGVSFGLSSPELLDIHQELSIAFKKVAKIQPQELYRPPMYRPRFPVNPQVPEEDINRVLENSERDFKTNTGVIRAAGLSMRHEPARPKGKMAWFPEDKWPDWQFSPFSTGR